MIPATCFKSTSACMRHVMHLHHLVICSQSVLHSLKCLLRYNHNYQPPEMTEEQQKPEQQKSKATNSKDIKSMFTIQPSKAIEKFSEGQCEMVLRFAAFVSL